ncbi:hypothetical protein NLI96_g6584 [Meripilus lineatus]|uniref:Peptidase A1 domain-containing protein n=1 Tax=Meripilus lineatus TaxID=2056292 RepID=A0AAD5V0Z4_9APHY|nr:hypothetical protein NLI96_g6584 [Physisporinus lineatus]
MRSLLPLSLLIFIFGFSSSSYANTLPFIVRTTNPFASSNLASRAFTSQPANNNTIPVSDVAIPLSNTHNAEYIANITLGGRTIPVLIDTGSSDLWVTGTVPNTKDTLKATSLNYAVGTAAGDINQADLEFAGYKVSQQAYLLVQNTSTFNMDIKSQGFEGLIGLGPNSGSAILDEIDKDWANSVLTNIFSQNTTTQNYLTVMLDRLEDPGNIISGQLTISKVVPGFENITDMPKLAVDEVHKLTDLDQHWQTYTDVDGIIGPDGQPIKVKSIVPSAPKGRLVVVLDTGYTLPQVPRALADAIYGRVQGAQYNEHSGVWTVPCGQEVNLTFKFGGIEYPIHPLDTSSSDFNMVDATGTPVCVGTFQPITSAFSLLGEYDIILGMAFMRNVYSLFDYGDWLENSKVKKGDPYIQLLSVTDKAAAHADFVKVRLGGVDTTGDAAHQLLPADQGKSSPVPAGEKKKLSLTFRPFRYQEKVLSRWPYILLGCLIFVILMIILIVWKCCQARKRRIARKKAKAAKMGIETPAKPNLTVYNQVDASSSTVHLKTMGSSYQYDDDPYSLSPHKERV